MFSVVFKDMILPLIPWFIRKPLQKAWLFVLIKPLEELHDVFTVWQLEIVYKLSITGQVIYLEKMLNDKFNNGDPAYTSGVPTGIYITDPTGNHPEVYLWNEIEQRPDVYFYNKVEAHAPVYLYNSTDYDSDIDFIVNVPTAVGDVITDAILISKIKARMEMYRIAGRKYKLENY